jgi:hypothetical protein
MIRIRPLLVLALLPAVAACGGSTATEGAPDVARKNLPSEIFSTRPSGPNGPLVGFDVASRERRFALPAGLRAADGMSYFAARARGDRTRLQSFDPTNGRLRRSAWLEGRWKLGGVSPSGAWVALKAARGQTTDVAVVAWPSARLRVLRLDGDFDIDAISADGSSLFLIQHLGDTQYVVRLYDLARARLVAGALRQKGSDEIMAGYAWGGTASPDGRWLLTLYLSTTRKVAFVHALNLENRYPHCIFLPSGAGDFEQLKRYSLTLSPDGDRVYAANPALGVVATVDLARLEVEDVASFEAGAETGYALGAMSKEGRTLYFASGRKLWAFDAAFNVVRGPYPATGPVVGLGFSRDGRRVYAADANRGVAAFDAATGRPLVA